MENASKYNKCYASKHAGLGQKWSATFEDIESAPKSESDPSPGPDQIPYILLKKMSSDQRKSLLEYYNYIFKNQLGT